MRVEGAYDPVNDFGKPQPDQVNDQRTAHEAEQSGAVRAEPLPRKNEGNSPLPEGLRRERKGPLSKNTGRQGT
jgi:hypothetical protein